MKKLIFVLFVFISICSFSQSTTDITPNGQRLIKLLDSTHLDRLWRKGYTINWLTGVAISKTSSSATHCSAFGAAFAYNLGIYLLRPPQHVQTLLANAQCIWLATDSARQLGWQKVSTALEAQNAADSGYLVVIGYQSPNANTSGHLAIVRPAVKTLTLLNAEGPQEAQSGDTNSVSISEKVGFKAHPLAFPNGVIYYRHNVNWDSLTLPVSFKDLQVINAGNKVKISWQTTSELNTSYFIVQQSVDGNSFKDIATENAVGNGANSYNFTDNTPSYTPPPSQIFYYRIKSIDKDGGVGYSKVVTVHLSINNNQLSISPNPATNFTTLHFSKAIDKAILEVYDITGKLVFTQSISGRASTYNLNTQNLARGVYILQVKTASGSYNEQLLINK